MNCHYCERILTAAGGTRKTKDHIIPRSLGGLNNKINLVPCCHDCNSLKGNRSLRQFIVRIEKKIRRKVRVGEYTPEELSNIVKNTRLLIANCYFVYERRLFTSKIKYEYYRDNYAV